LFLNSFANPKLIPIFDNNFVFKFELAVEKLTAFLFGGVGNVL